MAVNDLYRTIEREIALTRLLKHAGPGKHPGTGTEQTVHGSGGTSEPGGGETAGTEPSAEQLKLLARDTSTQDGLIAYNNYKKALADMDLPWNNDADIIEQAEELWTLALEREGAVSSELQGVISDVGGQFIGLEDRVKFETSIRSKLARYMDEGMTLDQAADKIRDLNRYTVTAPIDSYTDQVLEIESQLIAKGYTKVKDKNFWGGGSGSYYDGYNTWWESSGGHVFEVQFHTPESLSLKHDIHDLYSYLRNLDIDDPANWEERWHGQDAMWEYVNTDRSRHVPLGYRRLGTPVDETNPWAVIKRWGVL